MDTVPPYIVNRLDGIFSNVPGVDVVELAALLMELTRAPGVQCAECDQAVPAGGRCTCGALLCCECLTRHDLHRWSTNSDQCPAPEMSAT